MRKNIYYIIFPLVIISLFFSSCKVERDIAREFVQKENNVAILLLKDTILYKLNDKIKRIPKYDSLDVSIQDSLWYANTLYLDSVDDKKMINTLFSKIKSELEYYEFKVYTEENEKSFNLLSSEAYSFKITQIELEENKYTYRNEYSFLHDTTIYYKEHDLNKYDLNCWFELIPKDTTFEHKKIFYNSFGVEDKLDGVFSKTEHNSVKYKFRIFPVKLTDIYNLSIYSGTRYANFLFNYFMNKYIHENMPTGFNAEGYYSLDRYTGYIYFDNEENNENSFYEIQN